MKTNFVPFISLILANFMVLMLLMSGCTASTSINTVSNSSTLSSTASSAYTINVAVSPSWGEYLADGKGMTLYWTTADLPGLSNVSGDTLTVWPIFYSSSISLPPDLNTSDFRTITRSDGNNQTTYKNWPLYYYKSDMAPGDIKGQGIAGRWSVVNLIASEPAPVTPPTSAPTSVSPAASNNSSGSNNSSTDPTPVVTQSAPIDSKLSVNALESTIESIYLQNNQSVVGIQVSLPPTFTNPNGGALGSGFVWDTTGNIITNNHVISGSTSITVVFFDGTTVSAEVVGSDPDSDLAVIKVDNAQIQLSPVKMGDSIDLKVGQLVVAIGNPFGLQNTLTVGFVSALSRVLPANENATGPSYSIPDIIQTDTAINPGNSGGVLLDDSGDVIGVTSAIVSQSGSSAGIGFAIPAAIVKQVVPSLISSGQYIHPYLGVTVVSMNPDIASAMNLNSNQRGALIVDIASDGPADKAGLGIGNNNISIQGQTLSVGGDVIVGFNGMPIKTSDDLISDLARYGEVNQDVTLTVLRNNQQLDVKVIVGSRPTGTPTP